VEYARRKREHNVGRRKYGTSKKDGSEKGKCPLPYMQQDAEQSPSMKVSNSPVTNNSLQRLALALIPPLLLGWRCQCFPDDVVLVFGSDVWDTGVLT